MDTKKIIETLISDITDDTKSLSAIFLKLQVLVHFLKNDNLSKWFSSEYKGYDNVNDLPAYRILPATMQAEVEQDRGFAGSLMYRNYTLPIDQVKKEQREFMSQHKFKGSINEISNIIATLPDIESIKITVPANTTYVFQPILPKNCYIHSIWQSVSKPYLVSMMEQIKSCLLQFLLEINDNLNLNLSFTDMENKEKIEKAVTQNIYAGIVATGNNAIVSTNNSNVIGGQNNTISLSNDLRKKIEDIIPKITEIAQLLSNEQDEITTELVRINTQLNKNQPKMSVIGSAFQTIYSVLCSVAGNIATPTVLNTIQSIIKVSGI
ncbi:hypothetical protein EZS27_016293 [termite gut metagenome]|uniref:AbiTii domain-containing protein n=1 Tax=termite gut metagenome TaxID=433724 RepID=A0A5J4RR20_9ZZZZ